MNGTSEVRLPNITITSNSTQDVEHVEINAPSARLIRKNGEEYSSSIVLNDTAHVYKDPAVSAGGKKLVYYYKRATRE